jgi:peptidase C39-like protein
MFFNWLLIPTTALAFTLFALGTLAGRRFHSRAILLSIGLLLAIPGLLFVFYYTHLFDRAAWFYNFRAMPGTELFACGLGFLAGLIYGWSEPQTMGERIVLPLGLFVLVLLPFCKPILVPLDTGALKQTCEGEVCLQSTPSTCGPASTATLLKSMGIHSSEMELAREAYTYRGGTESWYLARTFRRRGLAAKVVIQEPDASSVPAPSIAGVLLGGGAGHFIAILNESPSEVTVADPLKGKLVIPRSELTRAYRFTGFFLVVKQ